MATLWSKISAVLPLNEEQFPLQFSDKVELSVMEMLRRSRRQLYSDTTSTSRMLNAQIILDFSWEKLNMGTWRDVDKEWRRVYSYGCLFKVAALCREAPPADEVRQAVRTCDMGLLMGAAIMDNILQVIVRILQGEVRKSTKEENESEHAEIKVSGLFYLKHTLIYVNLSLLFILNYLLGGIKAGIKGFAYGDVRSLCLNAKLELEIKLEMES